MKSLVILALLAMPFAPALAGPTASAGLPPDLAAKQDTLAQSHAAINLPARTVAPANPAVRSVAPPAPPAPTGPCVRGQSRIVLGGVDMDEERCQHFLILQDYSSAIAMDEEKLSADRAKNILQQQDVVGRAAQRDAEWRAYVAPLLQKK